MAKAKGRIPNNKLPTAKPSPDCVTRPYKPTKADQDRERRYRAEDALRAIQRAKEVESDSGLMRDVKALAREQMDALKKI